MANEQKNIMEEELELLKAALQLEQLKVRSLKKMLKAEYDLEGDKSDNFNYLLGLDRYAPPDEIKREFKKLLKALHPDRGGDDRLFKVFHSHYKRVK
ncbi:hypothetical protein V1498_16025 [Peribacillus sp. SCS-26]|uniref:hypothetical protein n=1 Tax=Paraperibacillus marinus TaxID=3115295 RepID=UPI003906A3AA